MSETGTRAEVAAYRERVRAALDDLPPSEVEEILEDFDALLVDVTAELGTELTAERLEARLGAPERFASELRAAAGLPPKQAPGSAPGATRAAAEPKRNLVLGPQLALGFLIVATGVAFLLPVFDPRITFPLALLAGIGLLATLPIVINSGPEITAIWSLDVVRRARELWHQPEGSQAHRAISFLCGLQQAWWVLRALLAAGLFKQVIGSDLLTLVFGAAAILVSVRLGNRSKADRRWWWAAFPGNGLAAGVLVLVLLGGGYRVSLLGFGSSHSSYPSPPTYGLRMNGDSVRNVYVYGPDGKPLKDVYLYDQDGHPLNVDRESCRTNGSESTTEDNRFPKPTVTYSNGKCQEKDGAPFVAVIPPSAVSTTGSSEPASSTGESSAPPGKTGSTPSGTPSLTPTPRPSGTR